MVQKRWHEHDPLELLASVEECIEGAMQKFGEMGCSKADIQSIGITNQRETTVVWDSTTGEPLYNAIVWPDTRTKTLVRDLKSRDGADTLTELCGLPLSTYPSSVKLLWLIENVDAVRQAYEDGRLAFGTVDSWLIYKLNGGTQAEKPVHVTDSTNASRTMFMNLRTLQYDDKLLGFFGIDRNKVQLPRIVPSSDSECFGSVARGALAGIRIAGCLGDQSSALVGQCGFSPGQAKNTYGTGCFLLYNVGTEPVISKYGLLATVAYDFGGGRKPVYALEGSIAVAGAGVKFLMNNLGFVDKSSEITTLAESVEDNGGVVFVTAFSGLFAPYWIDDAKGTLCPSPFALFCHTSLTSLQSVSPSTHPRVTSPVRHSRRRVTRPKPSSMPWRRTRSTSSNRSLWTVASPTPTFVCRPKPTLQGSPSIVQPCGRPPLSGPPLLPAWLPVSGRN